MSSETVHSFISPDEFLAYLQQKLATPHRSGVPDSEFLAQTQKQLSEAGLDPAEFMSSNCGLDLFLKRLIDKILSSVDESTRQQISRCIAFGVLSVGTINARILRSPDCHHAVIVHSGLMLLLNKYIKHVLAWNSPERVVYCNRKSAAELTVSDIRGYLLKLVDNCNCFGAPYGPMLRLDAIGQTASAEFLYIAEMFVVCHEIGHFLNRDLDDPTGFGLFDGHQWVLEYVENCDHAKEYAADETGFRLMCTVLGYDQTTLPISVIPPIVLLLTCLNFLYQGLWRSG